MADEPSSALPTAFGRGIATYVHRETWLSHGVPREAMCGYCDGLVSRLIASGLLIPDTTRETALRAALARAIEGGYADDSIDSDLYHNDAVYHALVWKIRHLRAVLEGDDHD